VADTTVFEEPLIVYFVVTKLLKGTTPQLASVVNPVVAVGYPVLRPVFSVGLNVTQE